MKKVCKTCKLEKDISEFYFKKPYKNRKGGLLCSCKICNSNKAKEKRRKKDPFVGTFPNRARIVINDGSEVWMKRCSKCKIDKNIECYYNHSKNFDKLSSHCKKCCLEISRTPEMKEYDRKRSKTRKPNNERRRKWYHKRKSDINFKIKRIWRGLLTLSLDRLKNSKDGYTFDLLGYSPKELKKHLEQLWTPEMSWKNYGEWEIDHIIPVKAFPKNTLPSIVNALQNLQPLWKKTRIINGIEYIGNLEKRDRYDMNLIKNKINPIKFGDFKLSKSTKNCIIKYLETNWITIGNFTKSLERKWSEKFNHQFSKLMSSGTSALMAALISLYEMGAKTNDEIITSALSFIATSNAIRAAGFKPIFVDIDIETLNINCNKIESKITKKTKAICIPNLMGRPCEMDKLSLIAKKHNLLFICDNCEAYGSKYKNKFSLEYSDIEVTSHFAAHITMMGEAGFCNTNNEKLDNLLSSIRSHGRDPNSKFFDHKIFGLNFKPMDFQAVIGLKELKKFDKIFKKRKENLQFLINETKKFKNYAYFNQEDNDEFCHAPHAFSIVLKPEYSINIDKLKEILNKNNIEWKRNFGSIPTQHKCFEYLNYKLGDFPNSEYVGNFGIHLPVHQYLKKTDLKRILKCFDEFFIPLIIDKAVDTVFSDYQGNLLNPHQNFRGL